MSHSPVSWSLRPARQGCICMGHGPIQPDSSLRRHRQDLEDLELRMSVQTWD